MGKALRRVILAGIVVGGGFLAYKYLLTPEAKATLKDVAQKGVQFGMDVHSTITGNDPSDEAGRISANQEFVADQWKKAGF